MAIMDMIGRVFAGETEMTKSPTVNSFNKEVVTNFLERLVAAKLDREAFDVVVGELASDQTLKSADLIEIAMRYAIPPRKLTSRAKALAAIDKRFGELVRTRDKNTRAGNTRPW
jgi:hypothetical protein